LHIFLFGSISLTNLLKSTQLFSCFNNPFQRANSQKYFTKYSILGSCLINFSMEISQEKISTNNENTWIHISRQK